MSDLDTAMRGARRSWGRVVVSQDGADQGVGFIERFAGDQRESRHLTVCPFLHQFLSITQDIDLVSTTAAAMGAFQANVVDTTWPIVVRFVADMKTNTWYVDTTQRAMQFADSNQIVDGGVNLVKVLCVWVHRRQEYNIAWILQAQIRIYVSPTRLDAKTTRLVNSLLCDFDYLPILLLGVNRDR